ncbi:MAG: GNAT family N-acetyltransferase [Gammaproteobacteria bacterium]|nr:GNAT family N-acetyltransferase [Gammaproteobacteria bacterium]MDH5653282.1 GNAT family N-acetyltransferase [Gammaproteobacteria bacterium]
MKFECYSTWDQLPHSATDLFAQGEKDSIFFSKPWFVNLSTALDDDQTMLLACVVDEHKVLAILPLLKSTDRIWHSLKHRYTTHYSLLLTDDGQQQVLACLIRGLSQLPFKALLLEPVADNDSSLNALHRMMESNGYTCDRQFRFYNWICRVQGQSFEEYMAARPTWLRNTISRKKRKLDRDHGFEIRLFCGDNVPQAMSDYYAAYSASWKANEQYVDFLNGIVAGFSGPGWSRLAVLYVKARPVAAQLWFVHCGKASIFRLAYDNDWKQYSPGSILTCYLMEYVIDVDKVEEIDFLTGNEAYKQDWMSERRERFALICIKSTPPAGRYKQFVESLRRIWKSR